MKLLIYNHFHIILRLFDVLPNFSFTASKTILIYIYIYIYIFPCKLLNNLRLAISGNLEISEKFLIPIEC